MNNSSVRLSEIFRVFLIVFFATFFEFLFFCLILKFLRIKGCFKYDEFFLFFQSVNFIFFSFPLLYGGFSDIKLKTADFKIDWNDLCAGVKYFFCLLAMVVISFGVFYIVVNNALKIPLNEESFPANFNIFYPPGRFFIYFVSFCFIAPFAEELFFRKILYVSLRGKFSFFSSMILSAFFFAIGHVSSPFFAFIGGVYLAYVYERKHSLIVNAIVHSFMNITVLFAGLAFSYFFINKYVISG